MTWRTIAKQFLPPIALNTLQVICGKGPPTAREIADHYVRNGRVPWSKGYRFYRHEFVTDILANETALAGFRSAAALPPEFGHGLDERCVEYPWIYAHLPDGPARVLDAGSVLNFDYLLDQPVWRNKTLHILTLAPEEYCYWNRGVSYLFANLLDAPVRDNFYDLIICASTLEHIGCDCTMFGADSGPQTDPRVARNQALRELGRMLKPRGTVLLTVPFGRFWRIVGMELLDLERVTEMIAAFGPSQECQFTFYRYRESGWQISSAAECADATYVDWIMRQDKSQAFVQQPDNAAAARAVACVRLVKP